MSQKDVVFFMCLLPISLYHYDRYGLCWTAWRRWSVGCTWGRSWDWCWSDSPWKDCCSALSTPSVISSSVAGFTPNTSQKSRGSSLSWKCHNNDVFFLSLFLGVRTLKSNHWQTFVVVVLACLLLFFSLVVVVLVFFLTDFRIQLLTPPWQDVII